MKKFIEKLLGRDIQKQILNKQKQILDRQKELEWAHIFHDSIKDKAWVSNLSLNIGRWAGNYSFFYVLNRILTDFKPQSIVEFGLGESSKFVSTFLDNYLTESTHTIIEQDESWATHFKDNFELAEQSTINILPLKKKIIKGFEVNSYDKIEEFVTNKYDLYLVDGPFGSNNYSRYDIVNVIKKVSAADEFIIMLDDYEREGEQQTFEELKAVLDKKRVEYVTRVYAGTKAVAVLGTPKYQHVINL